MPNTSSSVPFLLSGSMQSIRSRRTSTCLSSGPLGSGSGLLQQLGSGMVRQFQTANSNQTVPQTVQQTAYNGHIFVTTSNNDIINCTGDQPPPPRKCPSLNITLS